MTGLEERDAAAGAVAVKPRVTLDHIKSLIASERFFVDDTLIICVLTLTNGFKVTGETRPVDPANYNEEVGRKIAKDKAIAEIWPLAGFLLQDRLHREDHPPVMRCKVILHDRSQAYGPAPWDNDGKPRGRHTADRYTDRDGTERLWHKIDPTDPANIVLDGERLRFGAVCPPSCDPNGAPENAIFGEFTPFFSLETQVRNEAVLARLKQGAAYYVDFIPAD